MHGLKQTDSKYSGTSHGDRKSGAFSLFSSKESSSPPAASSSLPVRHILIVCLFYLEYIFPSSVSARLLPCCVPDRLAFLNDRLSLWEASSYSCEPFALQYEGKSTREGRGERERGSFRVGSLSMHNAVFSTRIHWNERFNSHSLLEKTA